MPIGKPLAFSVNMDRVIVQSILCQIFTWEKSSQYGVVNNLHPEQKQFA